MYQVANPIWGDTDILTLGPITQLERNSLEAQKCTNLHLSSSCSDKIVSIKFMRKYIHFAKNMKPTLTKEACEVIAEEYSRLRSQDVEHSNMARVRLRLA